MVLVGFAVKAFLISCEVLPDVEVLLGAEVPLGENGLLGASALLGEKDLLGADALLGDEALFEAVAGPLDEKLFFGPEEGPFGEKLFFGPEDYDTYLRALYGEYMELPPENKRRVHRPDYVDFEHSYHDYKDTRKFK